MERGVRISLLGPFLAGEGAGETIGILFQNAFR